MLVGKNTYEIRTTRCQIYSRQKISLDHVAEKIPVGTPLMELSGPRYIPIIDINGGKGQSEGYISGTTSQIRMLFPDKEYIRRVVRYYKEE